MNIYIYYIAIYLENITSRYNKKVYKSLLYY